MTRRATSTPRPAGWYPILMATATIGIASSVVFSLLGNLQTEFGFSDVGLGLIAGSGFVVGLIGQLLFAPFADRGHSKLLLLLGLVTTIVGNLAFAFSSSLWMLVVARCIVGAATALFLPAVRAIVISIDRERVAQRLGTLGGVELAGFVIGPTLGGLLVGPFGLKVPFLVTACFALAGLLLLIPRALPAPPVSERHRMAFDLFRLPGIRTGLLLSVAAFVPVGFYDSTLDRYLTDLGASDVLTGLAFLLFGIPFALLATTGGRIADRVGPVRTAVVSLVAVAPLTFSYGLIDSALAIVLLSALEGVIQALGIPAVQAAIARSAPEGRAGAAQGLAGASNLAIGAITAFSAGSLYAIGPEWVFGIAGAGVLAFTALAVLQNHAATRTQPS